MKRVAAGFVIAAVTLEGLYFAAINILLNTRLAPLAINRRPETLEIHWRYGWSLWPGMVNLHAVETRGRSRRMDWYARLDSFSARFHPLPLFHRTVHLTSVDAGGVVYYQRRIQLPASMSRVPSTDLPVIPAWLESPGGPRRVAGPAKKPRNPWIIRADRIACDVDDLWIERFRLTGGMRVETPMTLVVRGPIAFPGVRITMASGDLRAGDESIFERLGLQVEATVDPFAGKRVKGLGFFRHLSGTIALQSDSASLLFLEAYFSKTPWVRFKSRAGGRLELRLDHGKLQPGSFLDASNDHVDLELLDRHVTGKGVIRGRIEETGGRIQSRVTTILKDFELAPIGSARPFARGREMTLEAVSTTMDLGDPFEDLHVVVDLPAAEILDLGFYNSLFPPGSRFRFLSGTGTLRYHFEGSQEPRSLHGDIDFVVREGAALFENQKLRGGFSLKTRMRESSLREMLFDISGTRLELRGADPPWSAAVSLPRARMRFSEPNDIEASLRIRMQDTRPIVSLYDALKGAPRWIERMMIIEDIQGSAALDFYDGRLDINDIDVTGKGMHALGDLSLGKSAREGILYVRFHGFSLGIERSQSGRDFKLVRPLRWFQSRRALRRKSPQADSRNAPQGEPSAAGTHRP
jgi:hypothetical protein